MRFSKIFGSFIGVALALLPLWVEACPRCVDGTPFKTGLQWAIVVLLPLPFALGYLLYRFVRASIPSEGNGSSQP